LEPSAFPLSADGVMVCVSGWSELFISIGTGSRFAGNAA
jgi:hypothetical protein